MSKCLAFFDKEEREMIQGVKHFESVLGHLRYEGKVSWVKNVRAVKLAIANLSAVLKKHRTFQEEIVFPYLLTHIPKHESVIQFLRSDHQAIRKNKEQLCLLLKKLPEKKPNHLGSKIQELSLCLIYLVHHHIELEKNSIHRAIEQELKEEERTDVMKKAKNWLLQYTDSRLAGSRV